MGRFANCPYVAHAYIVWGAVNRCTGRRMGLGLDLGTVFRAGRYVVRRTAIT